MHDHDFLWSEANISTTATEKTPGVFAAKEKKFSTKSQSQIRFSSFETVSWCVYYCCTGTVKEPYIR